MENAGEESCLSSTGETETVDVVAKLQNYVNTWSVI